MTPETCLHARRGTTLSCPLWIIANTPASMRFVQSHVLRALRVVPRNAPNLCSCTPYGPHRLIWPAPSKATSGGQPVAGSPDTSPRGCPTAGQSDDAVKRQHSLARPWRRETRTWLREGITSPHSYGPGGSNNDRTGWWDHARYIYNLPSRLGLGAVQECHCVALLRARALH